MFITNSHSSTASQVLEENFNLISEFLSPSDVQRFSQVNSSLFNLHASQQAWKSLMRTIFAPQSNSTGRSTDFEEEKSTHTRESQETSSTFSRSDQRSSKTIQLRREILNSVIFPDEGIILQPIKNPIDFLLEKTSFSDKDYIEIKSILLVKAEKMAFISKKLDALFALTSSQQNQSLVSEITSLLELKSNLEELLQSLETDSMKKLVDLVRNTLSKQNNGVKEAYKEYSQKKRSASHHHQQLEDSVPLINQLKLSYQACLLAGVDKYRKNIENIIGMTGELQEKAPSIAENFNYFLYHKIYELFVTRLPENKMDLENIFILCDEPTHRAKVKDLYESAKGLSTKWDELSKQREVQQGKFSTRDNLLSKKLNFMTDVLRSLYRFGDKLAKAKKAGDNNSNAGGMGVLKPLGGFDKDKRIVKLVNMASSLNIKFNIFDWNNLILWNDLKDKISKELAELSATEKEEKPASIGDISGATNLGPVKRTPVKMRIKKNLGGSAVLDKDAFSKTMGGGFFNKAMVTPKKAEIARPKSSYKENNRSEITEEEEEYLRTTFHPEVKWKIV